MRQKTRSSLIERAMDGGIPSGPVDLRRTWAEVSSAVSCSSRMHLPSAVHGEHSRPRRGRPDTNN
jgi:hypothetical protein